MKRDYLFEWIAEKKKELATGNGIDASDLLDELEEYLNDAY